MSSGNEKSENIKSCIILCGGQSRRMGQDKGSMIIHNKPMIKHILSTLNHEINEAIIGIIENKLNKNYQIIWATGPKQYDNIKKEFEQKSIDIEKIDNSKILPYIYK